MSTTYFRRFRMEFDYNEAPLPEAVLPEGYRFVTWDQTDIDRHAFAKYQSFRTDLDSSIFPCLGQIEGCQRLMAEISAQQSFLPEATWLIAYRPACGGPEVDCGTIQGLAQNRTLGAIQNVGVVPEHRGLGLGRALLLKALAGFRSRRLRRVYLEVTAENAPAVRLYKSAGFRLIRTMYKAVEIEQTSVIAPVAHSVP
ncbi:MAG: N-acetyltransferase [Planctomycetaceae bacterium]|nr:N-acetyltransferase [Planctomycetaceae bacterium]